MVFVATLLSSCGPQWINRNRVQADYQRDRAACKQLESQNNDRRGSSRLQYGADPTADSFSVSWRDGELEERCMKNKGWQRVEKK